MDKILDIKLEEIEKEIKNIIIYYTKDDKKRKRNYSVYNPDINKIIEDLSNNLELEKKDLEEKNKPYKSWMDLTKTALLGTIIYLIFVTFTMTFPPLTILIPFILTIAIAINTMSIGDKNDIDREQQVVELLKKVEKIDNFVKGKGIHRVKIAQQQISKSIQYGADKTAQAVKNFASDVIAATKEEKSYERKTSLEDLKKLREEIEEEIKERQRNNSSKIDESLNRLDNLVDNERPIPKRNYERDRYSSTPHEYNAFDEPDPEYRNRGRRR